MDIPIKLHTVWSIVYSEGSQVIISKTYCISFSEDPFCLSKTTDFDGQGLHDPDRLSLHCLPKYLFKGVWSANRLTPVKIIPNPFMLNVFSHPYQLDESISNFRVVGWYFSFKFKRNFYKPTMENLIRR